MDVFLLKIDETHRNSMQGGALTKRTIKRLTKTTHNQRKSHIIYSDLLLQYVLYKKQSIREPLNITYNPNGKPLLSKGFFSISHCKEWVMCVYSDDGPIGADIEQYKELNLGLAKYFFTEIELNKLLTLTCNNKKSTYFIDTWTFKESYVKCKGISIFDAKNKINTPLPLKYFTTDRTEINGEVFHFVRGFMENYSWCVFSKEDFKKYQIKVVRYSELFKTINRIYSEENNGEHLYEKAL